MQYFSGHREGHVPQYNGLILPTTQRQQSESTIGGQRNTCLLPAPKTTAVTAMVETEEEKENSREKIHRCKKSSMCVPSSGSRDQPQYRGSDCVVERILPSMFTSISTSSRSPSSISPSMLTPRSIRKISPLSPDTVKKGRPKPHPFTRVYCKIRCPYLQKKLAPSSLSLLTSLSSPSTPSEAQHPRYAARLPLRNSVDIQTLNWTPPLAPRLCPSHHGVASAYEAEPCVNNMSRCGCSFCKTSSGADDEWCRPLYTLRRPTSSIIALTDRLNCNSLQPDSDNRAIALPESRESGSTVNSGDPISRRSLVSQSHPQGIISTIHLHSSMAERKGLWRLKKMKQLKKMQRLSQHDLESSTLDLPCDKGDSSTKSPVPYIVADTRRNDSVYDTSPTLRVQAQEPKYDQPMAWRQYHAVESGITNGVFNIWSFIQAYYARAKPENDSGYRIKAKYPNRCLTLDLHHTLSSHGDVPARVLEEECACASSGSGSARLCDCLPPVTPKSTPSTQSERTDAQAKVEAEESTSHKSEICQVERKASVVPCAQSENWVLRDVILGPERLTQGKSKSAPRPRSGRDFISSRGHRLQDAFRTYPGSRSRLDVDEPIAEDYEYRCPRFFVTSAMPDILGEHQQCASRTPFRHQLLRCLLKVENVLGRGNRGQENNTSAEKSKWEVEVIEIRQELSKEQMDQMMGKLMRLVDEHRASSDNEKQKRGKRYSERIQKLNEKMDGKMMELIQLHGQHCPYHRMSSASTVTGPDSGSSPEGNVARVGRGSS